uniref:CBM39 domain-containing protein n=1 Tax=Anopheles christyi TaxID=43041 RepID=A0A182KE18_9DIPT
MSRSLTVALCTVVLFSVIFQQVSCHGHGRRHHGRHEHHHHGHHRRPNHWMPFPTIDMYSPKGIEVSIPRLNATSQYFAYEMFINNPGGDTPDVAHNTTELVYGKFIVRDTEVIIKPGDALNVTTYMGFTNGGVLKNTFSFHVFRHMIKNNCTCENGTQSETTTKTPIHSIPPWSRSTTPTPRSTSTRFTTFRSTTSTTTTTEPIKRTTPNWNQELSNGDYSDEQFDCEIDPSTNLCTYATLIDERIGSNGARQAEKLIAKPPRELTTNMLLGIVGMVSEQCALKPRTNLLTLKSPEDSYDTAIDWLGYVRTVLKQLPKLSRVVDTGLVGANPNGKVIIFEMDTLLNKLHVLYLARETGMTTVRDFDDVSSKY